MKKYAIMTTRGGITMTEENRRYRSDKKPSNKAKSDRILNYLIGIVVVLIVVVAAFIFTGSSNPKKVANEVPKETVKEQVNDSKTKDEEKKTEDAKEDKVEPEKPLEITSIDSLKESKTVEITKGTEQIVDEVLTDPNWQAFPTKQQDDGTGHTSSYDEKSADWKEKLSAMAQITALDDNDLIIWFIKNNGGPDTAIGTISSKDKTKKYRVSLKWENKKGWKPVKVEVLNQINGAY